MARRKKGTDPVYAVEDAATGLYLNLDGAEPRAVRLADATRFPGTTEGRLAAIERLCAIERALVAELVRIDA